MNMRKHLSLLLLSASLAFAVNAQTTKQDTSGGKRPDFARMAYTDIKWTKAEGKSFWFYHKPTMYFFKSDEFETISLENGDFMAFIRGFDKYVLLPGYLKADKNVEKDAEPITNSECVFIRINRGRFWIYDRGVYVDHLARVGFNAQTHQYVYRSETSDKRYWIDEKDLLYGPMNTPIGIVAE
jgi:hypothetical protein